jgi:hypothetical protein
VDTIVRICERGSAKKNKSPMVDKSKIGFWQWEPIFGWGIEIGFFEGGKIMKIF